MSPFSLHFTFYLEDKFLGGVKDFTSLESKTNQFPLFLMFILYWSIIDLECFVSFRCTTELFSYKYSQIYSFSNYFPI